MFTIIGFIFLILVASLISGAQREEQKYVPPVEQEAGPELFPAGCALWLIPVVLLIGGYAFYLLWLAKPF